LKDFAISIGRTTDGRMFGGYIDGAWYNSWFGYRHFGYDNSFVFRFVTDLNAFLSLMFMMLLFLQIL
jgi:hypothetical protein